jgi:hypothetical protein
MAHDIQTKTQPQRRHDMDVMGALVVLGLIFFHTARIFDTNDFHVKNVPTSQAVQVLVTFAGLWGMPLMMLIAGIAVWHSLRVRTVAEFVRERFMRLFIPCVVGLLLIVPPQVYYRLQANPEYHETYGQFLQRYFDVRLALNFPQFIDASPPYWLFKPGHLWFLNYLFVYTLILLPLFLHLRRPTGRRPVERLAAFCTRRWAIFALALPIGLIEAALQTELGPGGWNRYVYFPILFYGYLTAADPRFGRALQRHWKSALTLGVLLFVAYIAAYVLLTEGVHADPLKDYDLGSVLWRLLKGINGWLLIVAIMGLAGNVVRSSARKKGDAKPGHELDLQSPSPCQAHRKPSLIDRVAPYAREAQLPFYILHQTVIVVIGFYVVGWSVSILVKYVAISLSSLVTTLALYDLLVKRTNVTRFLFGMRLKQKPPEVPAQPREEVVA